MEEVAELVAAAIAVVDARAAKMDAPHLDDAVAADPAILLCDAYADAERGARDGAVPASGPRLAEHVEAAARLRSQRRSKPLKGEAGQQAAAAQAAEACRRPVRS